MRGKALQSATDSAAVRLLLLTHLHQALLEEGPPRSDAHQVLVSRLVLDPAHAVDRLGASLIRQPGVPARHYLAGAVDAGIQPPVKVVPAAPSREVGLQSMLAGLSALALAAVKAPNCRPILTSPGDEC